MKEKSDFLIERGKIYKECKVTFVDNVTQDVLDTQVVLALTNAKAAPKKVMIKRNALLPIVPFSVIASARLT